MTQFQMDKFLFLLSATFLLLHHYLMPCLAITSLATDQTALLAFKTHLNSSSNVIALNWSTHTSCCNWTGITCGSRHERVTTLNLSYMGITGTIPPHIGNLSFLNLLVIRNNSFFGELPHQLSFLRRLKIMDLRFNKFNGNLPLWIGKFPQLQRLLISYNSFLGYIPPSIYNNMSSLQFLDLGHNGFFGRLPEDVCDNFPQLIAIYLHWNQLEGQIPSNIQNCSRLQLLSFSYNKLSGRIPKEIGNLTMLEGLYLGDNKLDGAIPHELGNLQNLQILYISDCSLSGSIPPMIFNISTLEIIALQDNNLTGQLPTDIGFGPVNLQGLYLTGNKLSGTIPSSISNASMLTVLQLSTNSFTSSIPDSLGNLGNLISLSLYNNRLSGAIPATVGKLQSLQLLSFSKNNLEGHIPVDLCLLKRVVYLYIEESGLSGSTPTCIGNLTSLLELRLSSNKLTSTLPHTLGKITSINILNLSSNSFSGNLPLEIGGLKALTELYISDNQLLGNIPSIIGYLQSLIYLSLAHNKLQGPIPSSFENLISLEFLDLSDNHLSGAIPMSLEKLNYLNFLNVSSNRLRGEIPNGGPFFKFSPESFMLNDELCGALQFKVAPCKNSTSSSRSRKINVVVLKYVLPTTVIIVCVLIFLLVRCRKKSEIIPSHTESLPIALRRISYKDLVQATDEFNEYNLLGKGSFGNVFKAIFSNGEIFAIKVFNLQLERAFKSFDVECEVLRNIRHRNLITIISSCSNNHDFKALVLEYMPNGNLEKWLYSHNYYLDIRQRLNIMIDVALAIEYLHHGYGTPIVHCDLKPSNILLDVDMVVHVGDFGISKLLGEGDFMKQTLTLATIGYMPPEYGTEGIVSIKGDVYSYGIMLMETFTRKKPTDEYFTNEINLKRWVSDSLPDSVTDVADYNLLRSEEEETLIANKQCISYVLAVALTCCADSPEERMDMKDVVARLVNIKKNFPGEVRMIRRRVPR